MPIKSRLCLKCNIEKPLNEMAKNRYCVSGREPRCLQCKRKRSNVYYHSLLKEQLLYNWARRRATRGGIEFNIVKGDIIIPKVCPVLRVLMVRPSLDRIDPTKGYIKGNIRVISYRANMLKNNATIEEMELILKDLRLSTPVS